MKKFLVRALLFAILFIAMDQIIGMCMYGIISRAKGDTGKNNLIANAITADVVLFGSSRCSRHYDPRIIEDSLGFTCYNAGLDGNGILLMYPLYQLISQRRNPKLVIYDLNEFDYAEDDHNKYLEWLRYLTGKPAVDSMIYALNPAEKYKLMCKAYRFNGKCLKMISDAIRPQQKDIMGYKPLTGSIPYAPQTSPEARKPNKEIDPFKAKYLMRMVRDCKRNGTVLIFVVSPTYGQEDVSEYYSALRNFCVQNEVPLLYHENDKKFVYTAQYFKDHSHLNHVGAELFTRMIIGEVKPYLVTH